MPSGKIRRIRSGQGFFKDREPGVIITSNTQFSTSGWVPSGLIVLAALIVHASELWNDLLFDKGAINSLTTLKAIL